MKKFASFAATLLFATPIVVAQPPGGPPERGGFGPPSMVFDILDANRDGELSAQEIANAVESLKKLDRNRDGKLAGGEWRFQFGPGGFPSGEPGGGSAADRERRLVEKFDTDKDGVLNKQERGEARTFVKENPRSAGPGRGRGGPPGGGRGEAQPNEPGPKVAKTDVQNYKTGLYDETVLRTFFLEFDDADWEDELADFYRTDVTVPARLTVDGKTYSPVGVAFRGNSSFFTVRKGQKRSFNITMDYGGKKQSLYGYRTLNLLNSHSDPSFLREVLYNHIARNYTAAPYSNFVKLVINGESWGIYGNAQQLNKDYTNDWFDSRGGVRWKISPGPGSDTSSLTYNGPDETSYGGYQLKSKKTPQALPDLIQLCKTLNETLVDQLDEKLESVMSVDSALWVLALDNVLLDTDGYHSRGSDYMLYQHPDDGRFHVLTYDSNETFRLPGRGGPPGGRGRDRGRGGQGNRPQGDQGRPQAGRGGPQGSRGGPPNGGEGNAPTDLKLSPFHGETNERLALIRRLLANPRIRARYLAYVRTITHDWLNWKKISPVIENYRDLIGDEVKADTRKLYPFEQFVNSLTEDIPGRRVTPGLRRFVEERGEYLRNHPDVSKPRPNIAVVAHREIDKATYVAAKVTGDVKAGEVLLYYASAKHLRFESTPMFDDGKHKDRQAGDGIFAAKLPTAGKVFYYVEARAGSDLGTTAFYPENTVQGAVECVAPLGVAESSSVVINELMAANTKTVKDPQGDYDDWLELRNLSDQAVDLSGMYLSDSKKNPRKWAFPQGTTIPANGYLVVWADEDKAEDGLHANFKLSKDGETVLLIDASGTRVLDVVEFKKATEETAYGRVSGSKELSKMTPTPGESNR